MVLLINSQPRGGSNEVNWWNSGERIKASSNVCSKRHEVVTGVMSNVQRLGISGVWGNGAARSREVVVRHAGLISKTAGVLDPHRSAPFFRWNISGHRRGSGSTGRYLAAIWHEDDQTGGGVRVLGQVISHVASETRSVLFSCGLRLFSGARGPSSRTVHADCKPAGL